MHKPQFEPNAQEGCLKPALENLEFFLFFFEKLVVVTHVFGSGNVNIAGAIQTLFKTPDCLLKMVEVRKLEFESQESSAKLVKFW